MSYWCDYRAFEQRLICQKTLPYLCPDTSTWAEIQLSLLGITDPFDDLLKAMASLHSNYTENIIIPGIEHNDFIWPTYELYI